MGKVLRTMGIGRKDETSSGPYEIIGSGTTEDEPEEEPEPVPPRQVEVKWARIYYRCDDRHWHIDYKQDSVFLDIDSRSNILRVYERIQAANGDYTRGKQLRILNGHAWDHIEKFTRMTDV